MKNSSETSMPAEQRIGKMARRARTISTVWKGIAVGMSSFMLILAGCLMLLVHTGDHRPGGASEMFWIGLPAFSGLLLCFWVIAEQGRLGESCRSLSDRLTPGHSDFDQSVSASSIGPLLELTLTGSCSHVPTAMLVDMLQSVRPEEAVVLTADQRRLLHVLVIAGTWDALTMRNGPSLNEEERYALRPPAISALAVLGNSSSIPVLERFIQKTLDLKLRASALQSIEQIRKRAQVRPAEMLRASTAPERPDTLLRAVSPGNPLSCDPQQLLRADSADAESQNTSSRPEGELRTTI